MPTEAELIEMARRAGVDPESVGIHVTPPAMTPPLVPGEFTRDIAPSDPGPPIPLPAKPVAPADPDAVEAKQMIRDSTPRTKADLDLKMRVEDQELAKARNKVQDSKDKAKAEVATTPLAPQVPPDYDAVTDAKLATGRRVAVAATPGHFQPDKVVTETASGVPIPEDAQTLNRAGFNERLESAARQHVAGDTVARAEGIAAGERAKGERYFTDQEATAAKEESGQRRSALARVTAALDKLNEPIETPHDRMQKWDIGKKIGFMLASAVSGAMGYKTNSNPFLESFQKFMDQDMAALKMKQENNRERLKGSQDLYTLVRQNTQSDAEARAIVRGMYWKSFASIVEQKAAQMGTTLNDAKFNDLKAAIDEKYRDTLVDFAKTSADKTTVQKSIKYVPPQLVSLGAKASGLKPEDVNKKFGEYIDYREKAGQPDREHVLNLMRRALERSPGGVKEMILQRAAQSPGGLAAVFRTMAGSSDPKDREYLSAVSNAFAGMARTEGGKAFTNMEMQLQQMQTDPGMFADYYGSVADLYNRTEADARLKLGLEGPQLMPIIDRLRSWHANAPGTSSRPRGAEVYESATPEPRF